MKRNYLAITMGMALGVSMLAGCGTQSSSTVSADAEAAETIYGEITSIDGESITLSVGTMKEQSEGEGKAPDETSSDATGASEETAETGTDASEDNAEEDTADETAEAGTDASDETAQAETDADDTSKETDETSEAVGKADQREDGEGMSMIDLTGEELTIVTTDETVFTKDSMGGGAPGGEMPGGAAPNGAEGGSSETDSTGEGSNGASADGETDAEKPDGSNAEAPGGETPPEKPDGDNSETLSGETPPEKPDGDNSEAPGGETPPEKPEGDTSETANDETSDETGADSDEESADSSAAEESAADSAADAAGNDDAADTAEAEEITLEDLSVGDIVAVSYDEDGDVVSVEVLFSENGMGSGGMGGMNGAGNGVESYQTATEYTEDTEVDGASFDSTGTDENAILVSNGATVSLRNITVNRTSSDSTGGDNSSFYGVGASILTTDGTTYLSGSTITSDAKGGAGVFSYGDGITYVSDTTITTAQDTSGGIHVAGGGTLYAWDLTVETDGQSSAAIRSDRGSGTMVVDGGSYTSNGTGSPAIYSTADITVSDAELTANGSEAICIEGLNTIRLYDCDLTGNMSDDDQNDTTWNVILYQSMSGDSEEGNSTFEMVGGSLTAKNGGMFYTTNTESTITLSDVDITNAEDSEFFLRCTGNENERGWGQSGQNGADCLFTAISQEMEGDVVWDSISELDFYMTEGSTLIGAVLDDESCAGNGGSGYCSLYIDQDSTWVVTGDSVLTTLYNAGTIVDEDGNTVTIQGTDGTVYVKGGSDYTITVDSYETPVDLTGASAVSSFSDFEVEKPAELS